MNLACVWAQNSYLRVADTVWTICLRKLYFGAANFMNVVSRIQQDHSQSTLLFFFFFICASSQKPFTHGILSRPLDSSQEFSARHGAETCVCHIRWSQVAFSKHDKKNSCKSVDWKQSERDYEDSGSTEIKEFRMQPPPLPEMHVLRKTLIRLFD